MKMNCKILFCLIPVPLIFLISCIQCENIFFPRRFVYRQYPQRLYQIRHDPVQAKPRKLVTRNNMFGWLNLKNYVRFHLWSRKNPDLAHEIYVNDVESLRTSNFNSKRLTKIIIHGYQDNANEVNVGDWIIFMRDAYLSLGDVNVIAVDYSFFATTPFYLVPMHELVGEKLKDLLEFLIERKNLDLNSVHLIGWSWGSHVAGMAAKALKGKVGRITGLDPAGPTFKFVGREFRLDKNDAKFVDVIHTASGTRFIWGAHFGLRDAIGHVDIYPNGGERQTGCPSEHTFNVESLLCNHGRAARYFTESITSPLAFPMCPCDDFNKFIRDECKCPEEEYAYLGEHLSTKTRGVFQIITRNRSPYGHGPKLNVTLPSIVKNHAENDIAKFKILRQEKNNTKSEYSSTEKNNITKSTPEDSFIDTMDEATIEYKNITMKVPFKNRYRSGVYPNDDILRMSISSYKKAKERQNV